MQTSSQQGEATTRANERLTRLAVLRRPIGASLDRIWENVLDWEHLPWLHASSFSRIECLESGDWGWRARAAPTRRPDADFIIEVRLERANRRYCSRTLEGAGAGSEIWTRLTPIDSRHTEIEVEFWIQDVPPDRGREIGDGYLTLYQRLWDEDEAMMQARENALAERLEGRARDRGPEPPIDLGPEAALRAALPRCIEAFGGRYRIVEVDGELLAHSTTCPHRLGPLDEAGQGGGADHEIECPWHGYRFDLRTGHSCDGRGLSLPRAPRVVVDDGTKRVVVRWDD
jgi:nitrite reductase/ring-hydroxylating ferredoxin subunit